MNHPLMSDWVLVFDCDTGEVVTGCTVDDFCASCVGRGEVLLCR